MKPPVNIVLPVYNRPIHTQQTISSLYKNTPRTLFSLIVIDDLSDGETTVLLRQLQSKYHFILFRNDQNLGPGESRNWACDFLQNDLLAYKYLYFSDNDVYFKPGWLEKLVEIYEQVSTQRVALLGASCHPYLQNNDVIKIDDQYQVGIKDAVSGYSHLITWEIWTRFKYFDSQRGLDKKTGRSDDWAFCQKLRKEGLLVGSVQPELIVPCGKTDSYGDTAIGPETFTDVTGVNVL